MNRERINSSEVGHRTVSADSVTTFGCLTGDYSQMHFDIDYGEANGMGGTIAHGLLSAAWSLGALTLYAPERLAVNRAAAYLSAFKIRFTRTVHVGDRFSMRWSHGKNDSTPQSPEDQSILVTEFEALNQRGEVTSIGAASVTLGAEGKAPLRATAPEPMEIESFGPTDPPSPIFAEDIPALGPRGISVGRTLTEADIVGYTNFTGERNPLYLNEEFALSGPFGKRVAPPMLTFCLGFGDYLRDLLSMPLPATGFAGHLGDSWHSYAPVYIGDTVRVRHKPTEYRYSKSQKGMAIVQFALQLENQNNEIVQDGQVAMMMPAREQA